MKKPQKASGWIAYMTGGSGIILGQGASTEEVALARAMQIGGIGLDGVRPSWLETAPATQRLLDTCRQPAWRLREDGIADLVD